MFVETGRLQGQVIPSGFLGDNGTIGLKFELTPTGIGIPTSRYVLLNADGTFALDDIVFNTYNITVQGDTWLKTAINGVTISADPTTLTDPIVLQSADCNGDNSISFEDFSMLQNGYGRSGVAGGSPLAAAAATGGCGSLGILFLAILGLGLGGPAKQ